MLECGSFSPFPILSYVTAGVSSALCLITIPGNLLICIAVYIDPYRRLRTPFNAVVVNLAFADLIVGCITEPLSVYLHIKEGLGREITINELRALHLSYFISCTASVLSISLLALERYISISYSFKYRLYFKVRRFVFVSILVWLIAIGLSMVYLVYNYVLYTFVFINIAVFWTLGVTTFCYVKILRKLKRAEKKGKEQTGTGSTNVLNVCPLSKAYVIAAKQNLACSSTDQGNSVDGDDSNVERGNEIGEYYVPRKESCSSRDEWSRSGSLGRKTEKINGEVNVACSSTEEDDTVMRGKLKRSENSRKEDDAQSYGKTKKLSNEDIVQNARNASAAAYSEYTSNKYNILVTKTYIIVSLIFLACYIPALLIIYTMNWCQTCSCNAMHIMRDAQFVVVIINSSVNPFLYSIRFAHFRRAISKILHDILEEVLY